MNSKSLLLITSEFPPQPGGIGSHAYHLARNLQLAGKNVTVLTDVRSSNGQEEIEFDRDQPFETIRVKRNSILLFTYLKRIALARKLVKSHQTILVSGKFSLFLSHWLKRSGNNQKWISIVHGSELLLKDKRQAAWVVNGLKKADTVIAVSNYTASLISNLRLNSLIVIPNGFALSQREIVFDNQEALPLRLITVGNVTRRKGQQNVVKALPMLLKYFPNVEYHIVGIPSEKEALMILAKEKSVANRLIFHGRVSEDKKIELLGSSSIFIMLSERTESGDVEGFGIAILEANSLGIPAIGSVKTGIEDAIAPGISGELVDASNPDEILTAIKKIIAHYPAYRSGAKKWSSQFTWDIVIQRYVQLIDSFDEN